LARQGAAPDTGRVPVPRASDDTALLARVIARDLPAFEQLYRCYHPRLTRFLMNMTHRPSIVDEVLNDTMLVVWNRPDSFNGASKLSSWIFAIAYRKALKALRQQDVPIEAGLADDRASPEPGPDAGIDRDRLRQSLSAAMDGLSPGHRTVVELTYFHDFGYREIAEIMDCPVDTVKTRMFYARRHLGRLLSGDFADWI
jgi:RNA polymerase sigma factor (sigma-70 family)